jgi:DNA-binding CsgD family transcriptional regulator
MMEVMATGRQTGPRLQDLHWPQAVQRVDRLTAREREVFLWLAGAYTNEQLAGLLGVTERTVRAHLSQILDKLQLDSRVAASLASLLYGQKIGAGENAVRDKAVQQ